jgi:hypothetical protein
MQTEHDRAGAAASDGCRTSAMMRCLFVEPLGEDFWLLCQQTFVVRAESDPQFSVSSMAGYVIVGINGGDPFAVRVLDQETGAELPCGHGRPEDWLAVSRRSDSTVRA